VAEIHLRGERPARFFGELTQALHGHLEEWTGHSLKGMTRSELSDFLREQGLEARLARRIVSALESYDVARFAASTRDPEEMHKALRGTRALLKDIEATRPRAVKEAA
jgi:hypothetical protein